MVEANIFVVFLYSNVVNKMLKIGLDVHTFLDWKWGLPKLIFGYLVGMSSFRWWVEHSEACSGWLDGFMEDHRYDSTTRFGRPTPFAPSTCVPSCKHPTKILSRGGGTEVPLGSVVSPKISKTIFLCLVYLMQWWNQISNLNLLDAWNKILEGKYEINTGLPHGEGS
jgi:hypothetical protein